MEPPTSTWLPVTNRAARPSPPPAMGALPIELIEHIVDFIGSSNDTQTLDFCALASRQLLPTTRHHKYSSICITCGLDIIPLQRFARLLNTCPWVADYVQLFDFYDGDIRWASENPERGYVDPWKTVAMVNHNDGTIGEDLPSVLNAMKKLRVLRLRAHHLRKYAIFSEPLRQALVSTVHRLTFHTLDVYAIEDIPATLFSSTAVKALHMKRYSYRLSYYRG
ncbi:hypothetical protein AX16_010736 [Volvariella volvacea WC 439]|nr:hypothetical protein AX16_010736 [Volvariella volvacea WC 439]